MKNIAAVALVVMLASGSHALADDTAKETKADAAAGTQQTVETPSWDTRKAGETLDVSGGSEAK